MKDVKVGDVFVQRTPGGSVFYTIVTGKRACVTLQIAADGSLFDMGIRMDVSFTDGWTKEKYGDPQPVEAAATEKAA